MLEPYLSKALEIAKQHPWLHSLGLLLLGLLAAWLVDRFISRSLKAFTARTATNLDDRIIAWAHRPIQLTVFLIALGLAAKVLIQDPWWDQTLFAVIWTIIAVLWTSLCIRISRSIFKRMIQRKRGEAIVQALPLLDNLVLVLLLAGGVYCIMSLWDISVTPLLASAGIATAAVAFAAKDTLANFFGGISIFVDHPYRLGDYIILDSGERGEVVEIGVRSTRLLTRDDVLITVPNAVMANAKIINQSGQVPRFRVRAQVGVAYDSDVEQVEKVLLSVLEGLSEIITPPTPRVRFRAFGDSALDFEILFWIRDPADNGRMLHIVNTRIHKRFKEEGIEIPFPQRVLHMPRTGQEK
ncbi:MAG: mechanosensitive ion channel family protein [Desulfarculaceae bacterium]|jgi:small-conductance mechanosensitive channel